MNAHQLLRSIREARFKYETVFRFPYVNLVCSSDDFRGLRQEERESNFADRLNTTIAELRKTLHNSLLSLRLLTIDEFAREYSENNRPERGHHWLSAMIDQESSKRLNPIKKEPLDLQVIHFYGYKGGQARSTLLGILSQALAEDGWKVLVVDSDIEAPSLDILYGRTVYSLSKTLLGVVQGQENIEPERVKNPPGEGYVDLIACRPKQEDFDIDASAFALRCVLDPMLIEQAAQRISQFAIDKKYDVLFVDHRSGLSPLTLPWMSVLPGPTVIFVRLDEQWRPAERFIKSILQTNPNQPGLFVSWKPDEEPPDSYENRNISQIDTLLDLLASTLSENAEIGEDFEAELSSVEVRDHWICWPYDSAFRQSRLPATEKLFSDSLHSLNAIRSLLDISYKKKYEPIIDKNHQLTLHPSGALDDGDLIQTEALRELKVPNNSITYILGRKGTGKTRLLRELTKLRIGEALLVDSHSPDQQGLRSPSAELTEAAELYKDSPESLWWNLLMAAIDIPDTSRNDLTNSFNLQMKKIANDRPISQVIEKLHGKQKRTFLIDGLETAFNSRLIFRYVEALFRFVQTIQSDSRLSDYINIKLFLRSDLVNRGYQNLEQQLAGKTFYLSWDTQTIFNFVLSRISQISWYEENFQQLVEKILQKESKILQGSLSVDECEELLMMAFPVKINRNNLATKTFLKTYFADSASDSGASDKLRYYPRIFDSFLQAIARPSLIHTGSFTQSQIIEEKINPSLIFAAHEEAARYYLSQLQSELNYLINLDDNDSENKTKIQSLLNAFEGLKTPFKLDDRVEELEKKTGISSSRIRTAIDKMKNVGMFEDRPDYPGELRVGRLFKSSLKMKYNRRGKNQLIDEEGENNLS
jgi:Mrp family chromosome partitioning ATPase/energy-coupling factor transporter ATP-binding protein EcfA2